MTFSGRLVSVTSIALQPIRERSRQVGRGSGTVVLSRFRRNLPYPEWRMGGGQLVTGLPPRCSSGYFSPCKYNGAAPDGPESHVFFITLCSTKWETSAPGTSRRHGRSHRPRMMMPRRRCPAPRRRRRRRTPPWRRRRRTPISWRRRRQRRRRWWIPWAWRQNSRNSVHDRPCDLNTVTWSVVAGLYAGRSGNQNRDQQQGFRCPIHFLLLIFIGLMVSGSIQSI